MLGGLQRTGIGGGTGVYVDTDSKDSTRYLLHLSQSGLGPARRVLLPRPAARRDPGRLPRPHRARCSRWCTAGSADDHADTAARIVALETKLAAAHWDVVKRRDADLTYNLRTFTDLPTEAPGFDWAGWVTAMGTTPEPSPRSWSASPTS